MTTAAEWTSTRRVKTSLPPGFSNPGPKPLATFLGLFSIGLGLAEALAPRQMARLTGVRHTGILRAYGLREIAAGVGILTSERPAGWLWGRVAGDVLDLATLAAAWLEDGPRGRQRTCAAAAAVAGVTVLDVLCAREHSCDGHG